MKKRDAKYSILVADDDATGLEFILNQLADQNYEIYAAINGQQVLEVAKQTLPDLIITDWDMPVMNGIEATKRLKANEKTAHIPIIMITGIMLNTRDLKKAFEAGVVDFLRKPLEKVELYSRINAMLQLVDSYREIIKKEQIIQQNEKDKLKREADLLKRELALQQRELDITKNELTTNAMQLIQISKLNSEIIETYSRILPYVSGHGIDIIRQTINQHKLQASKNNWEAFQQHFEKLHDSFYRNLFDVHPDLTNNERKLCAFLRLGMATKEISAITFQSEDSIKKARFRLRKKLELDSGVSFTSYLSQY